MLQANTAAATALTTLALHGSGFPELAQAAGWVTAVLITVAVDMALRSLANKLTARQEAVTA